MADKPLYIR